MDQHSLFAEGDKVRVVKGPGHRGRVIAVNGKMVQVYVFNLKAIRVFSDKELVHV